MQQFPSGRLRLVGLWGENTQTSGAQFVERSTIGSNRTGFQSYKQVIVLSRQRSSKRNAVPQGLCANLINALKLLATQHEDGDGLLHNIVTNLGEGSRKGLTDGLREFIRVDNKHALDVGALRRGTGTFKVRKPKFWKEGRMLQSGKVLMS